MPATKRMASNKEIDIATILFIFFFKRIFTKGFNRMAIINANANGTRILLNSKSINTKSIMPKRVTVDLKKKGYFFCINNEFALIKKRKRNERVALIFIKYFSKIKQTEAHKKFYLFHKKNLTGFKICEVCETEIRLFILLLYLICIGHFIILYPSATNKSFCIIMIIEAAYRDSVRRRMQEIIILQVNSYMRNAAMCIEKNEVTFL